MAAASIAGSRRRAASRRASSAPATPLSSTPRTPRRSSPVCGASRSSASCIARRAWRMCSSSSPAGICATDALDRGLAPQFPRLAQALGRLRALQPGRSADPAFRPRLRAGDAAAVGRGDVVYRLLRRRHAVLGDHVHRLVRIDVFRLLSHARPEDLGRHPLCAGHHRRRGCRRDRLGGEQGLAFRGHHPRRRGGLRPRGVADRRHGAAGRVPGRACLRRGRPHHDGAREELGLLQLLHDAHHDADDHDLGRVLPGRAAAGRGARGGAGASALPRHRARAPARGWELADERAGPPRGAPRLCGGRLRHRAVLRAPPLQRLMLWIKSLHIIFMVTWFAGLFYLPRLYVYHAMADDAAGIARFKIMERKLFYGIMTPGGVLTVLSGLWLWLGYGFTGGWLHAKVTLVLLLVIYHVYCGRLMLAFKHDRN